MASLEQETFSAASNTDLSTYLKQHSLVVTQSTWLYYETVNGEQCWFVKGRSDYQDGDAIPSTWMTTGRRHYWSSLRMAKEKRLSYILSKW